MLKNYALRQEFVKVNATVNAIEQQQKADSERIDKLEQVLADRAAAPVHGQIRQSDDFKDDNDLKIELKGFLYDTPKETISAFVNLHYSSYITPLADNGLTDVPFVPGKRSTKMLFEFKDKKFAWKFLKYVNANRVQSEMPRPLSGDDAVVKFRPWAAFAQDAATKSHASVVGKVARTLHIIKESGKLLNFNIETSYGSRRNMFSGKVIVVEGSRSILVASIKSTEYTWSEEGLTKIGLTQKEANAAISAM